MDESRRPTTLRSARQSRLSVVSSRSTLSKLLGRHDPENCCFIFDWDDTLFPTTWQEQDGTDFEAAQEDAEWLGHAKVVIDLLDLCAKLGRVAIVTLARRPWVTDTARKFFPPSVLQCIESNGIEIFYAREWELPDVSSRFPRAKYNPRMRAAERMEMLVQQKVCAMRASLYGPHAQSAARRGDCLRSYGQFWAIGDGTFEMYAAHDLFFESNAPPVVKTVKFFNEPNMEDLTSELVALKGSLMEVFDYESSVHLDFDELNDEVETLVDMLKDEKLVDPYGGGRPMARRNSKRGSADENAEKMAASGAAKTAN